MAGPIKIFDAYGGALNASPSWPSAQRGSKLFSGTRDVGGTGTEQDTTDLTLLRQRSASVMRSGGLGPALLSTMVGGVVGQGLQVMPELIPDRLGLMPAHAEALEEELKWEWVDYAHGLNFAQPDQGFGDFLSDVLRESLEFGDACLVTIRDEDRAEYKGRVQLIESVKLSNRDRLPDTLTHNNGITFSSGGRALSYDLATGDASHTGLMDWTTLSADFVIHTKLPKQRVGAARGVPWLSHSLGAINALGEYSRNEIISSWVATLFSLVHKSDSNHPVAYEDQEIQAGSVFRLGRDESLEGVDSDKPARTFSDFYMTQAKTICASVGLPLEIVLRHFQSSYSASRGAVLLAEATFKLYRSWLVTTVCQPLYTRFVEEALRLGRVSVPGAVSARPGALKELSRADWVGSPALAIDLNRLSQGLQGFDALGVISKRRMSREYFGVDYRRTQKERAQEEETPE